MIHVPKLNLIGGDLNVMGNLDVNESHFPSLETIKGDLITANSGFTKLPQNLKRIGGRLIISKSDPTSFIDDLIRGLENGLVIKGDIYYCD